MEWINTKGMTHDAAPQGPVLVQYLEPFFGLFYINMAVGFYDNPNDYEEGGQGWRLWQRNMPVCVLAYALLPPKSNSILEGMRQDDFLARYGSFRPEYGSIGLEPPQAIQADLTP